MREPPGPCGAGRLRVVAAPLLFRAPEGCLAGPGCLMHPWAAARPLAVRAASFARRVVSKPGQAPQASRRPPIGRGACVLPGQAPPPPTGTAAKPRRRGLAPQAPRLEARPVPAHQFRMQFPSVIMPICVSLQCYVTCVFELHATYVSYWPRCHPSVP